MYPIAVIGDGVTAAVVKRACAHAGFTDVDCFASDSCNEFPAATLAANTTRILHALGLGEALADLANTPDREQVRFARSGYLLAEVPLGNFYKERYGSELINVEQADLARLVNAPEPIHAHPGLEALEQSHKLLVVAALDDESGDDHAYFHSSVPNTGMATNCNVTWLGDGQTAWQFSTNKATHLIISAPRGDAPDASQWNSTLDELVATAKPIRWTGRSGVRDQWVEGRRVFLGAAAYPSSPYLRESVYSAFEDAWVLSRMLENYEEDIHDGLTEYERYRRPRARRLVREAALTAQRYRQPAGLQRLARNLGLALSARFLPEIAMSKRDWFHSYDCIKGFR
jgi:salicylate hydroxylase